MGCDIHIMTEKLHTINNKEKWINIDLFKHNPYREELGELNLTLVPIFNERNYILFSILANIRNYYNISFIDEPRGIPIDISKEVVKTISYWGSDGHSHSYFTLKELKDYVAKNPKIYFNGYVAPTDVKNIDEKNIFPSSSSNVKNKEHSILKKWECKNEGLRDLILKLDEKKKGEFYFSFADSPDRFDDKIRIIFWFDN